MAAVTLDPRKLLGFRLSTMCSGNGDGSKLDLKAAAAKVGGKGGAAAGAKGGGDAT